MATEPEGGYYDDPAVVAAYEAARERGLRERERRAIDRYFDPDGAVLDLGCGAGRTSSVLAGRGFDTVGLDVSRAMLQPAADADADVAYVAGDAARLPFADGVFPNVLFSYNGIDELRPPSVRTAGFSEVYRVLAPGGRFAFSSHNLLRWLLPLPPTPRWLRKVAGFWLRNARLGMVGTPAKHIDDSHPVHFGDPLSLVRLLRAVGFEVLELLGKSTPGSALLGNSVFVVAEKPEDDRVGCQ